MYVNYRNSHGSLYSLCKEDVLWFEDGMECLPQMIKENLVLF